jgi:mannitol-1-/sugar-/sorbitol-6-phosphatase
MVSELKAPMDLACEAVLFDLDGVLVDSTATVERHWRVWATERGIDAGPVLAMAHGRRTADVVREFTPELDAEGEAERIEAREARDTDDVVALPGADRVLRSLPSSAWAIVTSGTRELALARLRAVGLPVPSVLVCAGDVARGKPDPEGYTLAAKRLGVAPDAAVVVEDAPVGVAAARAAGAHVIALLTTYDVEELAGAKTALPSLAHVRALPGAETSLVKLALRPVEGGSEGSTVAVRPLAPEHERVAAELLAEALLDDPGLAWVRPGRRRRRALLRRAYRAWLPLLRRRGATMRCAVAQGQVVGVAISIESDRTPPLTLAARALAPPMLAAGPLTALRALAWGVRMQRAHPRERYVYLDLLGVRSHHQGRGIGRMLLDAIAREADALGIPLVLSTNHADTVRFYERAGFVPLHALQLARDVPTWVLRRPAEPERNG